MKLNKILFIVISTIAIAAVSCGKKADTSKAPMLSATEDSLNADTTDVTQMDYKPMTVVGDWRGDGVQDTLFVHYYSNKLKKNVAPVNISLNDKMEYDDMVGKTIALDPAVHIYGKHTPDTLTVSTTSRQLFGLYFIENLGDLDGDGSDEIVYMVDYADWSTINTVNIDSYKNGKWITLYSFPVWEWQFENDDGYTVKSVLTKLPDNKIKITFRNDEAMEETKVVDLSKVKPE